MKSALRHIKHCMIDAYWDVRGPRLSLPSVPIHAKSILFVCKGNICRSPFAEHLASNRWPHAMIGSAGLHVSNPMPAPAHAIQAAKQYGLDLEKHRSQSISEAMIEKYDMIVAMEAWQLIEVKSRFRGHRHKIHLLASFGGNGSGQERGYAAYNIADPYGGSFAEFDRCFERISHCVTDLGAAIFL